MDNKEVANQVDASQENKATDQEVKKSDIILVIITAVILLLVGVVCMVVKASTNMVSFGVMSLVISIMCFIMLSYHVVAKHKNNK